MAKQQERLTLRGKNGVALNDRAFGIHEDMVERLRRILEKLAEYEDQEEARKAD